MKLHIDIEVVNQVLGYLGTRPYQEVFSLIQAIQDAAKPQIVQEAPNGNQVDTESN
jgi:hypothetical protein